jgi:hypothetical protein
VTTLAKARIPRRFKVMGHTVTVRRLPLSRWKHADCVGYFDPQKMVIAICTASTVTAQEQCFWHEATHAMLYCLGSPDYANEALVDQLGGLIHQITSTSVF